MDELKLASGAFILFIMEYDCCSFIHYYYYLCLFIIIYFVFITHSLLSTFEQHLTFYYIMDELKLDENPLKLINNNSRQRPRFLRMTILLLLLLLLMIIII